MSAFVLARVSPSLCLCLVDGWRGEDGGGGLGRSRLSYVSRGMNQDLQGVYTLSATVNIIEKVVEIGLETPIGSHLRTAQSTFFGH